ncbi:MAG: PHP domain-containing protein [Anaerovoracaceae bacterium]
MNAQNNYNMIFDYHTHTTYSHGKGSIEDNVKVAKEKNLSEIAISDHNSGHIFYGIAKDALPKMQKEIIALQKKYPEIEIHLSVEANINNTERGLDVDDEELSYCDFIIAGYHFGVPKAYIIQNYLINKGIIKSKSFKQKMKKKNTEMYINALKKNDIKILTHPGDKAEIDLEKVAKTCAEEGTWIEISTHHRNLSVEEIQLMAKYPVNFVLNSDAHTPERVGDYESALDKAIKAGIDTERIVNVKENIKQ